MKKVSYTYEKKLQVIDKTEAFLAIILVGTGVPMCLVLPFVDPSEVSLLNFVMMVIIGVGNVIHGMYRIDKGFKYGKVRVYKTEEQKMAEDLRAKLLEK